MTPTVTLDEATRLLGEGGVVALPTDTVYGVGASLAHPSAVARLFTLKRRPATQPLPVLIGEFEQLSALGVAWSTRATRLSDALWPGGLTIVVPVNDALARLVGSDDATVGFRQPDDDALRQVLSLCGPLAVSSANEHGEPAATTAADVVAAFAGRRQLDGVYDGGVRAGQPSTVVSLSDDAWTVLREGAVSRDALAELLG